MGWESDSTADVCRSDMLARLRVRGEKKNPAPELRRAADGWEQISKRLGPRILETWVFSGLGLPGNRSPSTAGGTSWEGGASSQSCSESPSVFDAPSGVWGPDFRQQ